MKSVRQICEDGGHLVDWGELSNREISRHFEMRFSFVVMLIAQPSQNDGGRGRHRAGLGAEVLPLPLSNYSPDDIMIEDRRGGGGAIVRRLATRTNQRLPDAVNDALRQVTTEDRAGWVCHSDVYTMPGLAAGHTPLNFVYINKKLYGSPKQCPQG